MENNRIYPPRRVMVSKPFIIEKSSIFFREEISGENSGESEMVAFWYTKKRKNSIHIRFARKDHAGRYCILKTGLTEIGNDKGRAWIVTEGSEIKSFFFADFM